MKSSAPLAVFGILSCILLACCAQSRQASATAPPATTYQVSSFEFQSTGPSRSIRGASVTSAFFQGTKAAPLLGRGFLPEEYSSSPRQVVLVGQRFWEQQFGADPRIIGTTVHLNGQAFTVIGVMPKSFDVPSGVDIWVPKTG